MWFDGLLPAQVLVAEMDPRLARAERLYPEERELVAAAVPKRAREFAAGRLLARELIARLGGTQAPLLARATREPVWPPTVTGSITHTDTWAAAAVAPHDAVGGLGIDLEPAEPLPEELLPLVVTAAERERLGRGGALLARVLFSAKEAVFKAQFPRSGAFLDFPDVEVELRPDGTFDARLAAAAGPFAPGFVLPGRWRVDEGLIATAVTLARTDPPRHLATA